MFSWIIDKYKDWKFEKEFQKRKKELMEIDPFIYEIPEDKDDKKNKKTS